MLHRVGLIRVIMVIIAILVDKLGILVLQLLWFFGVGCLYGKLGVLLQSTARSLQQHHLDNVRGAIISPLLITLPDSVSITFARPVGSKLFDIISSTHQLLILI